MLTVTIHLYSFLLDLSFLFLAITHPPHVIGLLTTLVFIIASFHPFLRTSITHLCLLIVLLRDSITFHHVPFALSYFWNFPSLRYINPWLATYSPKLDLLCTLVPASLNLAHFLSSVLWLFESLRWCSEPVSCPKNPRTLDPMSRKSLGRIFEPSTLT